MKDSIEREVLIEASCETVWKVITTPQHINQWLWDFAEIDLTVGGAMTLAGTYKDKPYSYEATIEHLDPPNAIAFRWAEGGWVDGGSTRIDITLVSEGSGTRLRLVESGFASLEISAERYEELFQDISFGWTNELNQLVDYMKHADLENTAS